MKNHYLIVSLLTIFLFSCNKDDNDFQSTKNITNTNLKGAVQKGPFINGTSIDVFELDNNLSPTGNVYTSQILDNSGLFELSNISLYEKYAELRANGYYFNEVTGANSSAPIILSTLTNVADKTTSNINILSHLAKNRVKYLMESENLSYLDAQLQAREEILSIFSLEKPDIADFDLLDITVSGDDNAILLAISVITQGYRTESELSDLLANISTDITEDGSLDDSNIQSLLINDARLFDLAELRNNVENRYQDLGMSVTIPDFETYVNTFVDSTSYTYTNYIDYPEYSDYGENVLFSDKEVFSSNLLSLAAELPRGTSLKIVIKNGQWSYVQLPNAPINWKASNYDNVNETQTFTVQESGKASDLIISFQSGNHVIEYYENGAQTPTRIKNIEI